jgi:zinc protease
MVAGGVTADELAKAKQSVLEQLKARRSGDGTLTELLAKELAAGRTLAEHAELERRIAALTPGQVQAALKKHIDPKRLFVVVAGDLAPKAGE